MKKLLLSALTLIIVSCGNSQYPKVLQETQIDKDKEVNYYFDDEEYALPALENIFKSNISPQALMLPCYNDSFFKNTGSGVRFYSNSEDPIVGTSNYIRATIRIPKIDPNNLKPYNGKEMPIPYWYLGGEGAGKTGWPLDLGLSYVNGEIKVYGQTNNGKSPIILDTKVKDLKIKDPKYMGDVYSFEPDSEITIEMYINQKNKVVFNVYANKAKVYSKYTNAPIGKQKIVTGNPDPEFGNPIMTLSYPRDDGPDGHYPQDASGKQKAVSVRGWGWKSNVEGYPAPNNAGGQPLKYNVTIAYNKISDTNFFKDRNDILPDSDAKILVGKIINWNNNQPQSIKYFPNWNIGNNPNIYCQTAGVYGWTLPDIYHTKSISIYMPKAVKPCLGSKGYPLNENLGKVFVPQSVIPDISQTCLASPLPELDAPDTLNISGIVGTNAAGTFELRNTGTTFMGSLDYALTNPDLNLSSLSGTLAGGASQSISVSKMCTAPGTFSPFPVVISGEGAESKTVNVTVNCSCPTPTPIAYATSLKSRATKQDLPAPTCDAPKLIKPTVPDSMTLTGVVGGNATGKATISNGAAGDNLSTIADISVSFSGTGMTFNPDGMYLNAGDTQEFAASKPCMTAGTTNQDIIVGIDADKHVEKIITAIVICDIAPELDATPKDFVGYLGNIQDFTFDLTNTHIGTQPFSALPVDYSVNGVTEGNLQSGQPTEAKFSYKCENIGKYDVPVTIGGVINYQGEVIGLNGKTVEHAITCLTTPYTSDGSVVGYTTWEAVGACSYGYYEALAFGMSATCHKTVAEAAAWASSKADEARANLKAYYPGCNNAYDKCVFKETGWVTPPEGTPYPFIAIYYTVGINQP